MIHPKKIIAITALFVLCTTSRIFATGAGIQISGNPGLLINEASVKLERFTGKITGTLKSGRIPLALGFGLEAGDSYSDFSYGFFGFADFYAADLQLKNTWNLYSGFGAEGSLLTKNFSKWTGSAGARFFTGMNWLFYDNYLELYCQQNIVPTIVKYLNDSNSNPDFMLCFPFEAGVRMHF